MPIMLTSLFPWICGATSTAACIPINSYPGSYANLRLLLYHTAEHLAADPKLARLTAQVKNWKAQRNILAFYDGRPLKILPRILTAPDTSGLKITKRGRFHFSCPSIS
jgi:hypothetical protein